MYLNSVYHLEQFDVLVIIVWCCQYSLHPPNEYLFFAIPVNLNEFKLTRIAENRNSVVINSSYIFNSVF